MWVDRRAAPALCSLAVVRRFAALLPSGFAVLAACGPSGMTSLDAGRDAPTAGDARVDDGVDAGEPDDAVAGDSARPDAADASLPPLECRDDAETYALCGRVTYDYVPARDDVTEGGVKLDYEAITPRPARRVRVEAGRGNTVVAEADTRDDGSFVLRIPRGTSVTLRAIAFVQSDSYAPDAAGSARCNGASWDVTVTDNTLRNAVYALEAPEERSAHAEDIALHAPLRWSGGYTRREAAPFAILDTIVTAMERVCGADPSTAFPELRVRWSVNNTSEAGSFETGHIGTSYYQSRESALYLLGAENVDTDEYDDHVVAHEYGHYIEDKLYRSDGLGGDHSYGVRLDPRVAFTEGYGTAFACMVFDDPAYVDTRGAGQGQGFSIRVSEAPAADNRGVYSERSVQQLLWRLFDARRSYDRIHAVLVGPQKNTQGFTSSLSFAAHYNAMYGGDAEGLRAAWTSSHDSPYDALCRGSCAGSGDGADPFDSDDDLGAAYASDGPSPRALPRSMGMRYPRAFWQLFRTLEAGDNAPTAHEQTRLGGYDYPNNTLGAVRWYCYVGTGRAVSIGVEYASGPGCDTDDLDMEVRRQGVFVTDDRSLSGCPRVRFNTTAGTEYQVTVYAPSGAREVSGFSLSVDPKPEPPRGSVFARPRALATAMSFLGRYVRDARGRALEVMRAE